MHRQLEDFYNHLNDAVITTNDFAEGTKFRKREYVQDYAYCGLNPKYRAYLSFDLDFRGAARHFENVRVPVPTIITTNRDNGHCHYLYRLITPVAFHNGARTKPQQYFEAVQDAMTDALKADRGYVHACTKNPLHPRWITEWFPAEYHLSDFSEYVDLKNSRALRPLPDGCIVRGRNDELFNRLRVWAYGAVQSSADEVDFCDRLCTQAEAINDAFDDPLPYKEVAHTAKSTSRWVWRNRTSFKRGPKVLTFTDEPVLARLQAGAAYTNQIRRQKAEQIVYEAVKELLPRYGAELSTKVLVERTGQNIKTIRKYMPNVMQRIRQLPLPDLPDDSAGQASGLPELIKLHAGA